MSMTGLEMIDTFGEPNLVTEYHRPTMVYDPNKRNRWGCGYWMKKNLTVTANEKNEGLG